MAIVWGAWSGYFRLGIDLVYSGQSCTIIVYGQSDGYGHNWSGTLNFTGSWSGSKSVSFYSGHGQTVTKELHRSTTTGPGSRSYGANISYWSGAASVSRSVTIAPAGPSGPPPAPTNLTATKTSDTSIRLNWTPRGNASAPVQHQIIQRRYWTSGGWSAWVQVASLATGSSVPKTWTDTTVKAGNTYEYRVAGKNSKGQSGWSNVVEQYTRAIPPTNVKATLLTTTSAKVTWSQSGQGTLRTYFERRVDTGSGWEQWQARFAYASAWAGSWTDTSVPAGARVQYRAWSVPSKVASWINDATLQSAYSEASNVLASLQPPNAPSNLAPNGTVVVSGEPISLSWAHNSADTTEQTRAQVQWRRSAYPTAFETIEVGDSTQKAAIPADQPYTGLIEWQVRTWGEHSDPSPWSTLATVTAIDRPGVAVTTPEGDTWDTPELDVAWSFYQAQGRPQSAWNAELLDKDRQVIEELQGSGATATTRFSTRIENGVTYVVRARAATGQIWSDWAEQTFTAVFLPPDLPDLAGSWDEGMGAHTLSVTAGDKPESDKPETVRIDLWRSVDQGTTWELVAEGLSTDAVVSDWEGLSHGDTQYRAVAWTHAGANAETVLIIPADSAAAWVGKGSKFEQTAALRHKLAFTPTTSLAHQETYHFSGKTLPDEISGESVDRRISVTGTLLAERLGLESHTAKDFDSLASTPGTVVYRDPEGRRWYGALTSMSTPQGVSGVGSVSYTIQETNKPTDSEVDYGGY